MFFKDLTLFFPMNQRILLSTVIALLSGFTLLKAQNVGIGIAVPLEKLHVSGGNLRVSTLAGASTRLVGADANGTLTIVAAGTNGQVLTQTAAGPAFQNSNDWIVGGNSLGATGLLGSITNQHVDLISNNLVRGRLSNLGEFFIGTTNTVIAGDLMNGVANAAFDWAVNGYSDQDGSGVYGQVTAGGTIFAGVQGEYNGTNASGAGVRGLIVNTTAGTGFNAAISGVNGSATTSGTYKYGVFGSGGTTTRSGGVMGYDYGLAIGAMGYYAFNGTDYAVYGFGQAHANGLGTGRSNGSIPTVIGMDQPNTCVGMGIYGGVMGGWVVGMKYGMHVRGERTSLYVDGNTFTNQPIAQLVEKEDGSRITTFVPSSTTADVYSRGKGKLANGEIFVRFDDGFKQIITSSSDLTITATPSGPSNGVYVTGVTEEGFWVKENNSGTSGVDFSWIAVGVRKGAENMVVSPEILEADYDAKMRGFMQNDNSTEDPSHLWWDGSQVRFDAPPAKTPTTNQTKITRPGVVANDK
jgi:hypothetical protein